jgi:hypothetical protein
MPEVLVMQVQMEELDLVGAEQGRLGYPIPQLLEETVVPESLVILPAVELFMLVGVVEQGTR